MKILLVISFLIIIPMGCAYLKQDSKLPAEYTEGIEDGMEKSDFDISKISEDVTLTIKENEYSEPDHNFITFLFTNDSDTEYFYGEYFCIEKNIGGEWYNIPLSDGYAFHDVAYILRGRETSDKKYYISCYNVDFGSYRLVTKITNSARLSESYIVVCEFTV